MFSKSFVENYIVRIRKMKREKVKRLPSGVCPLPQPAPRSRAFHLVEAVFEFDRSFAIRSEKDEERNSISSSKN